MARQIDAGAVQKIDREVQEAAGPTADVVVILGQDRVAE